LAGSFATARGFQFDGPPSTLPADCATSDFTMLGRPFMFPPHADGVTFGISAKPGGFAYSEPFTLYLWIDNPTDKPVGIWTCMGFGAFWRWGFDVFDSDGHRVLSPDEQAVRETLKPGVRCHTFVACSRNFQIFVPPHSCSNVRSIHSPHDFS